MYKLLLCWRYLRTRYLAFACIISVMLGVATLIVVNSVMGGFSTKLKDRLHGLLSDVVVEAITYEGIYRPDLEMDRIRRDPILHDKIAAMCPTLEVFSLIQFPSPRGGMVMRPVHLIGIDAKDRARVGGFAEYLIDPRNRANPSFDPSPEALQRQFEKNRPRISMHDLPAETPGLEDQGIPPPDPPPSEPFVPRGVILGYAIAHMRNPHAQPGEPKDIRMLHPGDEATLITISGQELRPVFARFVVCDYIKSEMSEYDANYVYVPLDYLQLLRTMQDRVTTIQIKLKDYRDADVVVQRLQELFELYPVQVMTWEQKQGALLAAISIERGLLNVLLFLIIAVAGFGILAIFSMIVVEKTRDIGILKALGASNVGVMNIFLGYGLLLGVVGAGLGTILGLEITTHINEIDAFLAGITGRQIFRGDVYYFEEIPIDIQPWNIFLINLGAVAIAVFFSVLPALRAAFLQPVRALRFE